MLSMKLNPGTGAVHCMVFRLASRISTILQASKQQLPLSILKTEYPIKDAVGVEKLKEAGAIIIGKMNMHQLGMGTTGLVSYYGTAKNPWNSDYIPGGSSSGSAAAVSSGMCYATLDTDAIGSCRLPAACCGVVGFKGTYSIISSKGILEGEDVDEMILWLSHPGIITRSVEDTAFVLDVLAERKVITETDRFTDGLVKGTKLRIGVANNLKANKEVMAIFEKAIEIIRDLGHMISNVAAPFDFGDLSQGVGDIETARKTIAGHVFKDIDILLLPTLFNNRSIHRRCRS